MRSKGLKEMRLYIRYRMNSDIKKLTKAQKQIANEFENSIVSPPKQDKRNKDHQNPPENHHHLHQYLR